MGASRVQNTYAFNAQRALGNDILDGTLEGIRRSIDYVLAHFSYVPRVIDTYFLDVLRIMPSQKYDLLFQIAN